MRDIGDQQLDDLWNESMRLSSTIEPTKGALSAEDAETIEAIKDCHLAMYRTVALPNWQRDVEA